MELSKKFEVRRISDTNFEKCVPKIKTLASYGAMLAINMKVSI